MPRERLPMRKIHDVLRLHADGLSKRRIAVGLNIGRTAVGDYPGYLSAPRRRVTPVAEGSTQTVVGMIW